MECEVLEIRFLRWMRTELNGVNNEQMACFRSPLPKIPSLLTTLKTPIKVGQYWCLFVLMLYSSNKQNVDVGTAQNSELTVSAATSRAQGARSQNLNLH